MAKYEVSLAKAKTYTDMATGTVWKKGKPRLLNAAEAGRYKTNPKFIVKEVEAPKPKAKPVVEVDEGEDESVAPKAKPKKVPTKKKA